MNKENKLRAITEMEINFRQQGFVLNDIFYFDLEEIYEDLKNA